MTVLEWRQIGSLGEEAAGNQKQHKMITHYSLKQQTFNIKTLELTICKETKIIGSSTPCQINITSELKTTFTVP